MARSKKPSPVLAALGVIVLGALAGFGAAMLAPSGASTASSGGASPGAWIAEIKKNGELRVACADSPPTSKVEADGSCDGPVLLPFKELAEALDVEFVNVGTTYQSIIAGLQAGKYDIAANIDATMARTLAVRFTVPGWTYEGVFVIPRSAAETYPTAESILIADAPVATAQGTSFDQALALRDLLQEPVLLQTYQDAAQAMKAGRASSLFTDIGTATTYVASDPDLCIVVPDPVIVTNSVVNGVSPNIDEHSLQTVNFAIEDSVNQGRFAAAMTESGYIAEDNLGSMSC
ncbi:substrate-binding periplasmic protein [Agromyces aerolatus]|uniref:substrate-binding periplasmic protein n=1 Tax=Agromyces sp. LY-1074 TaxID=3074080 RepID=UPI00285A3A1E|nr:MULTISPECIES: transporter substrate-binding domain-containing protein [unclassified Agromyces]MDR5701639.1 transporter substrate-binding domain-containing protein [Agromyces sp. LY-1074]MDR5707921.1 transporter substrate-binding domain-containing protein [Agromyces sp. LY-1358]